MAADRSQWRQTTATPSILNYSHYELQIYVCDAFRQPPRLSSSLRNVRFKPHKFGYSLLKPPVRIQPFKQLRSAVFSIFYFFVKLHVQMPHACQANEVHLIACTQCGVRAHGMFTQKKTHPTHTHRTHMRPEVCLFVFILNFILCSSQDIYAWFDHRLYILRCTKRHPSVCENTTKYIFYAVDRHVASGQ